MDIDLNKKQQQVLEIIRRYPEAANDEAMLLDRFYHEIENYDDTKSYYWNISRSTRAETITRRRRELFNLGLITYSDNALKVRTEAFNNEREHAAPKAVSWLYD